MSHALYHVMVHAVKNPDDPSTLTFFLNKDEAQGAMAEGESAGLPMAMASKQFDMSPDGLLVAMEWAIQQSQKPQESPDPDWERDAP
jgi:hypothetical protein